jgi:hypothetical protein
MDEPASENDASIDNIGKFKYNRSKDAEVAELADAQDSKSCPL